MSWKGLKKKKKDIKNSFSFIFLSISSNSKKIKKYKKGAFMNYLK